MFSAIVTAFSGNRSNAHPSPEAVVRTLSAMVPASIAGIVADLKIVGPLDFVELGAIADHAGCEMYADASEAEALRRGLAACRREFVLAIRAGYGPGPGFLEELADLPNMSFRAAVLREGRVGWFGLVLKGAYVAVAAPKPALLALQPEGFDQLVRQVRPDRTLRCRALWIG